MKMRKIVAILAAALMLFSILPISAFAANGDVYDLVTNVADLAAGDQIIIAAKDYNYALSTTQNNNNRGQASVTKSGASATLSTGVQVITLEAGANSGTFAFNVDGSYLYAASSSSNYLRIQNKIDGNASWKITIAADGTATVIAQGTNSRNVMQYNQSSSLFACYGSASQKAIVIYKAPAEGGCAHDNVDRDFDCEDGACLDCGETVTGLGHEFDNDYDADCNYGCGFTREVEEAPNYVKASALNVGDIVVLVAELKSMELSGVNTYGTGAEYAGIPIGAYALTVEAGSDAGTYAFKCPDGKYLYWNSGNSLNSNATKSVNTSWSVSFDDEGNAIILNAKDSTRKLQWNASSPRFACYASQQTDVQLFVLSAGGGEEPPVVECEHDKLECGELCPVCGEYTNPNEHVYVDGGKFDTVCDNCGKTRPFPEPEADSELTIAEVLELGAALGSTTNKYYVSGVIVNVYNTTYGNLNLTDGTDTIVVYGLYSEDGSTRYDAMSVKPIAGDTITVYGAIGVYQGKGQVVNGWLVEHNQTGCAHEYEFDCSTTCSLCGKGERDATCVNDNVACQDGLCIYCGNDVDGLGHTYDSDYDADCNYCGETREVPDAPAYATITFDADKTQRTEFSTTIQKWENDGLTLVNNKASSTTNIGDYSGRFYKDSEIIISFPGMTSLVIDGPTSGEYAWTATLDAAGLDYTAEDGIYTITFAEPVNSITLTAANQVRANNITASAVNAEEPDCEHEWIDATCTAPKTCSLCGETEGEALGHTYVDGICSACGAEKPAGPTKIDSVANLTAGIYYLAGYSIGYSNNDTVEDWSNNPWHVWTGEVYNGDLVTTPYYYNENTGEFGIVSADPTAATGAYVELITVEGKANTYYIVYNAKYLASTVAAQSRKLALVTEPAEWVATANENGGITLSSNEVYMGTGDAASRLIRAYKSESTLKYGVVLFSSNNEEPACQHEYDNACDVDCNLCYEAREVEHSVKHVEAKAATCNANGNIEHWYCDVCGMAWLDEACTMNTNLRAVVTPATGEHVYFDGCSAICEVCGYEREVSHNIVHVEAKAATCNANGNIEYWYCDVCGMAWLDEACTLNTNLRAVITPATSEHTYDDEYDADCNICGEVREVPEKPVDVIYGDANGDGEITVRDVAALQQIVAGWDVEYTDAADANGDGEITVRDVALMQQYLAGWEVTLGPDKVIIFNDGVLGGW